MGDVFVGSQAVLQGKLSRYQLRTGYRAIHPNIYLPFWAAPSLRQRSEAAWLWTGRRGVLAGLAAAALHGSNWIDDDEPVDLIWRNLHPPAGVITRNQRLDGDEITHVARLPVTTRRHARHTTWVGSCRAWRPWPGSTRSCGPLRFRRRMCSCSPSVIPAPVACDDCAQRCLLSTAGLRHRKRRGCGF